MKKLVILLLVCCLLAGCTTEPREDPAYEAMPNGDSGVAYGGDNGPGSLAVVCGQTRVEAMRLTTQWNYKKWNGSWTGYSACGLHPLNCRESLTAVQVDSVDARLEFALEPDRVTVGCWPDSAWDDPGAQQTQLTVTDGGFQLLPGGYVYEVHAWWESDSRSGDAYYCFYIVN